MQQNSQDALMNWILSQPCGYISHFSAAAVGGYCPTNFVEYCLNKRQSNRNIEGVTLSEFLRRRKLWQ